MRSRALMTLLAAGALATLLVGCGAMKRSLYAGDGRDEWQKPDEVVALLGLSIGDKVADIGAGGGYFTFRLADAVGAEGRVFAVDVDDEMISFIREKATEEGYEQIEGVRGEFGDPKLPDGEVDLVFTCNTYHHIQDRAAYFARVLDDLVPNGRVAIVDYGASGGWFTSWFDHNTPKETIVEEMGEAGYSLTHDYDLLEKQSFLVFEPKS